MDEITTRRAARTGGCNRDWLIIAEIAQKIRSVLEDSSTSELTKEEASRDRSSTL